MDSQTFAQASQEAFLPTCVAQFVFPPALVAIEDELVLFDTGLDAAGMSRAINAAGHAPCDVTPVVINHVHPDRVRDLICDGSPTFANAGHMTGRPEFDCRAAIVPKACEANVVPISSRLALFEVFLARRGRARATCVSS
ncbi:hypothetical protein [Jannaschia seosinensis]|nr:hypothetical protein [Jannaschia seosinensis]